MLAEQARLAQATASCQSILKVRSSSSILRCFTHLHLAPFPSLSSEGILFSPNKGKAKEGEEGGSVHKVFVIYNRFRARVDTANARVTVSTPTLLSWKFLQDFASRKNMCARKKGITKERKEGSVSSGNRKK